MAEGVRREMVPGGLWDTHVACPLTCYSSTPRLQGQPALVTHSKPQLDGGGARSLDSRCIPFSWAPPKQAEALLPLPLDL